MGIFLGAICAAVALSFASNFNKFEVALCLDNG